jgi:FPC/CPF motif-containing protein YcgG
MKHKDKDYQKTFEGFIEDTLFPCVGAKSAHLRHNIEFFIGNDIQSSQNDSELAKRLEEFSGQLAPDSMFVSFVALFPNSSKLDETEFEKALWQRLEGIHEFDRLTHEWDPEVSDDPASPHFSMSFGGKGFYIIGLHPSSSRIARRFECAALVFNIHSQFEQLRADGRYDKLKKTIVERDIAMSGSANPMLAVHGETSEARQYSGRHVENNWQCPFKPKHLAERHGTHN